MQNIFYFGWKLPQFHTATERHIKSLLWKMSFLNSSNPKLVSKYLSSFHCNIFMHEQLLCAHARKKTKTSLKKCVFTNTKTNWNLIFENTSIFGLFWIIWWKNYCSARLLSWCFYLTLDLLAHLFFQDNKKRPTNSKNCSWNVNMQCWNIELEFSNFKWKIESLYIFFYF